MTKKQKALLYKHMCANEVTLQGLYKNPSKAKEIAADYCERQYHEKHGYNKRYHSANSFSFCFSFKFRQNRTEYLQYETAQKTFIFKIADIDDRGRAIPCM